MATSKRCRECRQTFTPDPRVGARQHTCPAPECQRARHIKDCRDWRIRTRPDRQEARLRRRLRRREERTETDAERAVDAQSGPGPGAVVERGRRELDWVAVRDEIGVELTVVLREIVRNLVVRVETGDRKVRDEIAAQLAGLKGKGGLELAKGRRDETDVGGPGV